MAVYRQTYKPYDDELTEATWRFWVLARYAFQTVFAWRLMLIFFVLSFVPMLAGGSMIYLMHNIDTLLALDFSVQGAIPIDAEFFGTLMGIQSTLAFFMSAIIGPGLVSPDLTNGALPLYLSRPFSRTEYTLGKFAVLAVLISLITWVPGLLLFVMQASLAGGGWAGDHIRLAIAMVVGSCAWILTISLMALALSAWVRWRPVAGALLFAIFFAAAGFGGIVGAILNVNWGWMLNLSVVMAAVFEWLFTGQASRQLYPLPIWTAWVSLGTVWVVSVWLISRKVRAYEVVR